MQRGIDSVVRRIRAFAVSGGISNRRLAARAGISEGAIRQMGRPDWNPRLSTLRALEAVVPDDFAPPAPATRRAAA